MLLSTHALVDLDSFKQQIGDNLHGANVIYIKASLKDSQHKMVGDQTTFKYIDHESYIEFRELVIDRVGQLLERYNMEATMISHIVITFIPVDKNFISKYKVRGPTAQRSKSISKKYICR